MVVVVVGVLEKAEDFLVFSGVLILDAAAIFRDRLGPKCGKAGAWGLASLRLEP